MNERTTVKPGMPTGRGRGLRRHLLLGTALATSAFIGGYRGYVRRAYAGCTGGGGTYTCGDTTTTTQTLTGTPLVVTTAPGFSIDTTGPGGSAFLLSGTNGLTFTDNNQSTITGAVLGIYARNDGSGALSITATGTVTGRGSYGILARASGNATGVTIEAVDVSGAYSGIGARNDGSGALSITATGTVTGTGSYGIFAVNGSTATDLTIEAADVSGADRGILATNNGSGALSITATGTVTGANGSGIYAVNGTTATDLTIEAVDVSGATRGIDARNYGGVL
ncbi:hypothetical protein LB542_20185, partial [Mesorhizobium sp. BR1-1-9]|nr:hypothetical protein [Mesorhizobium sp. BR1-1-9]MBZ9945019.1 hypothetical protein [Mesorhizobium sp. BR1-1-13]